MNKLTLIIGALFAITFAPTVYAVDSYWVLGSFKNVNYAIREAERIRSESGGLEIQVARFDVAGAIYNRILLRKDGNTSIQQVIQASGIMPWSLEDESAAVLVSNPRPGERTQEITDQLEPREPEVQIASQTLDVTPPQAYESYMGYCIRKANPTERKLFCTDDILQKMSFTVPDTVTETRVATANIN